MSNELAVQRPESALAAQWAERLNDNADLSDASKQTYSQGMNEFLKWLKDEKIEQVGKKDIERWKSSLKKNHLTANTINTWLTSIRNFFEWAEGEGLISANPIKGVKGIKRKGTKKRHLREKLTDEEVLKVLSLPDRETPIGKRDYAILCLKAFVPIRDIEIHRADLADLSISGDRLVLKVHPKGSVEKDETKVLAAKRLQDAMLEWIEERGRKPGALFVSFSDRSSGERLTLSAIRHIVIHYYRLAGILSPGKTSHSMRHSAITQIVKKAGPMKAKEAAGHVSLDTTMIYYHEEDRLDDPGEAYIDYGGEEENG
jgi:site-specific recombinase XerD